MDVWLNYDNTAIRRLVAALVEGDLMVGACEW
jgi:hypothetical protein